jgi:hypothetical protein
VDTVKSSLLPTNNYKTQKHYNYLKSLLKERVFTKAAKMLSLQAWVVRPIGLIKEKGRAQELHVICAGLPNGSRECFKSMHVCN